MRNIPIVIFGTGGMGGPLAEQLARVGCENITLCDNDIFEVSNLNRQSCTREDIGKYKVDVVEDILKKINSEINVNKFYEVHEDNISDMLKDIKVATLLLDDPVASILISRECYKKNIPMLESWTVPYLSAWWFTKESLDYETCYGFQTHHMSINDIKSSENLSMELKKQAFNVLLKFPNIQERYDREKGAVEGMLSGKLSGRSFAPIVRIAASYITFEVIFTGILRIKNMIQAPKVIGYDYFQMKIFEFSLL